MPMDILTLLPSPLSLRKGPPASNNAGNHIPRSQTFRGTTLTFGYLCKSVKKTAFVHTGHLSESRGQQNGTVNYRRWGFLPHLAIPRFPYRTNWWIYKQYVTGIFTNTNKLQSLRSPQYSISATTRTTLKVFKWVTSNNGEIPWIFVWILGWREDFLRGMEIRKNS